MKILAIETSCDDTGIAILEAPGKKTDGFKVLSNVVASQIKVHKKYGGVFPAMAKREHQRNLVPTFVKALREAGLCHSGLDPAYRTGRPESRFHSNTLDSRFRGNDKEENKVLEINKILEREPELAKKLIPFLQKYQKPNIDAIAVTIGPGLEPCLWVGVNFARALSYFWDIPLIPVNHIEGHILVNWFPPSVIPAPASPELQRGEKAGIQSDGNSDIKFPAIALIVSGGHTQLVLIEKVGKYKILGETRDDAAGECFDKCAKILGLGYPGGPEISRLASQSVIASGAKQSEASCPSGLDPLCPVIRRGTLSDDRVDSRFRGNDIALPRPMLNTKDYDFSFSGLKTAVLYHHQKQDKKTQKSKKYIQQMSAEIQQAIIDVLLKKTFKAIKDFNAKTLILGGGVSANQELRKQFTQAVENHNTLSLRALNEVKGAAIQSSSKNKLKLIFPPANLSTDNGLMIAMAGWFNIRLRQGFGGQRKKGGVRDSATWQALRADANLRIGE